MIEELEPPPISIDLRQLFPSASFVGCGSLRCSRATDDSRKCRPGTLFAARPGTQHNGAHFIRDAVERGISGLLVDRPFAQWPVPQCVVADVNRAYAELTSRLWGNPAGRLAVAGVTGTNGKSTVTWLIRGILNHAHKRAGLLGTIEYSDGRQTAPSHLTTPAPETTCRWLTSMIRNRTQYAALELSSHALHQHRAAGLGLDVAIVTNITQDHFDYHENFENYRAAKARILDLCKPGAVALFNTDDPGSLSLLEAARNTTDVQTFGDKGKIRATDVTANSKGTEFRLRNGVDDTLVRSPLIGRHNISNCLAAAAACLKFGLTLDEIAAGIEAIGPIPGRLERIDEGQPFDVFVDYAHTPDALSKCIAHLREHKTGRLFCVFGAGGDRDREKRPLMARAVAGADVVILTNDNPRTESPEQIADDIRAGFDPREIQPIVELDRGTAIDIAIQEAKPGDTVLIAGKGHETSQTIGTDTLPFSDQQTAAASIRRRYAIEHSLVQRSA